MRARGPTRMECGDKMSGQETKCRTFTSPSYLSFRPVRARSRRGLYDIEGHHHKDNRAFCTS
jgi:hypothetical protein